MPTSKENRPEIDENLGTRKNVLDVLLAFPILLLVLAWVFRRQVRSGGAMIFSDRLDGRIALSIQEHWSAVFSGTWAWHATPWFFPWERTLGYNDGYLLHGVLHAAFRVMGADIFLAGEFTNAVLLSFLFVATFLLIRHRLRLGLFWVLLGAAVVCASNNYLKAILHVQFLALGGLVLVIFLVWTSLERLADRRYPSALLWGCSGSLLTGVMMLTSPYIVWAGVLLSATFMVIYGCLFFRLLTGFLRTDSAKRAAALACIALVAVVAALPAVWLYLPVFERTGLHSLDHIRGFAPRLLDLVSVDGGNVVWSWSRPWLALAPDWIAPRMEATSEGPMGTTPLLLACTVVSLILCFRRRSHGTGPVPGILLALGLAAVFLVLLTTDFGIFWAWPWVIEIVPGASGFRALVRMQMLVGPIFVLVAMWGLSRSGLPAFLAAGLGLLILVEQANLLPPVHLDRQGELHRMAGIPAPPPGCRAFAAARPRGEVAVGWPDGLYNHNVDAMIFASVLRLPTINGMSSLNPPDWNFADPNERDYGGRVRSYAARHAILDGLCGLNFENLTWTAPGVPIDWLPLPPAELPEGPAHHVTSASPLSRSWLIAGWSTPEAWGVWSEGSEAVLALGVPARLRGGGTLRVSATSFAPGKASKTIDVSLIDQTPRNWNVGPLEPSFLDLAFGASDVRDGVLRIRVVVPDPVAPADFGINADHRRLGLGLRSLEWR